MEAMRIFTLVLAVLCYLTFLIGIIGIVMTTFKSMRNTNYDKDEEARINKGKRTLLVASLIVMIIGTVLMAVYRMAF